MLKSFLVLCLAFSFLEAEAQLNKSKINTIESPDKQLMQEINDAWSTLNPANAAKYYDQSTESVFYDSYPFEYRGWKSYSEGAKAMLETLSSMKYVVGDDAVIRTNGDIAFGTATLHLNSVNKKGNKNSVDLRWTVIWERKENNWLIGHEHLSVPAEASD